MRNLDLYRLIYNLPSWVSFIGVLNRSPKSVQYRYKDTKYWTFENKETELWKLILCQRSDEIWWKFHCHGACKCNCKVLSNIEQNEIFNKQVSVVYFAVFSGATLLLFVTFSSNCQLMTWFPLGWFSSQQFLVRFFYFIFFE